MKRYDADAVAAIAATVTAVAALVVAVRDSVQSRAYDRVSVQPILVIDARRATSDATDEGEFVVSNQGVGPAVIRNVRIFYDPIVGSEPGREAGEPPDGPRLETARPDVQTVFDAVSIEIDYESVSGEEFPIGTDGAGT
ncbi:MAG: hypothetical protein ACODAA_02540 [Gemmatimonadota bacterium]